MASNDVLLPRVEPCSSERSEFDSRVASDFGEFYYPPSDSQEYPRISLMYNGKTLNVRSELVHASLSGISIKHHYGKCYQEIEEEDQEEFQGEAGSLRECQEGELDAFDWYGGGDPDGGTLLMSEPSSRESEKSLSESGLFEYREDSVAEEGQPICTLPRINYRNSFWNIHAPELCKLTWGQKYVSAATVTDHLHEHLTLHGQLCVGFHTEEERSLLLRKELDEYVRLKVLACPRELPPDEPQFELDKESPRMKPIDPRCKGRGSEKKTFTVVSQSRYFPLRDDEEIAGKNIRRSKEEFCLTIGKHISKPLFIPPSAQFEEAYITPELSSAAEEESALFFYDWYLYGEQAMEGNSVDEAHSTVVSETESEQSTEPCPPLMLDDLCRAVGKADFSDLRCDPDF